MNKTKRAETRQGYIRTAPLWRKLARQCGFYAAAAAMRNQGYSADEARAILILRLG